MAPHPRLDCRIELHSLRRFAGRLESLYDDCLIRYGRIGTSGASLTKTFPSEVAAQKDADRLIAEKKRKGYREVDS